MVNERKSDRRTMQPTNRRDHVEKETRTDWERLWIIQAKKGGGTILSYRKYVQLIEKEKNKNKINK